MAHKASLWYGILERPEDTWCNNCQVSSLWTGPVWQVCIHGLTLWGKVTGCAECGVWHWFNLANELVDTDKYIAPVQHGVAE